MDQVPLSQANPPVQNSSPTRFVCDEGLGGLARWLRAAGYEAHWISDVEDKDLLKEVRRLGAILLTTDSMLMERRVLRDGLIRSLWISPALGLQEQLESVLRQLDLPLLPPRCMACGGVLAVVQKENLRDRIPSRTYRWLNEFFVCQDCGKVFWHGTHWQKIKARLLKAKNT